MFSTITNDGGKSENCPTTNNTHGGRQYNIHFPRLLSPRLLSDAIDISSHFKDRPRRHSFLLSGSSHLNREEELVPNRVRSSKSFCHHETFMDESTIYIYEDTIHGKVKDMDESPINGTIANTSPCSSDDEEMDNDFFEGVEKLLEVWFTRSDSYDCSNDEMCNLRRIPRIDLENMLTAAKCEIISSCNNSKLDAYVLSESSMFISKRRFILKTCGTTTPLECIPTLQKLVQIHTGFNSIENIFYSRKNFTKPELQLSRHRSFEREVELLDNMFPDGSAYCMGTLNRDCWYLYTLNPLGKYVTGEMDKEPDQTIEILMQDLDPKIMAKFTKESSRDGKEATVESGIHKLLPNMTIDDFLFEPCGYSMNGILNNEAAKDDFGLGEYMTIHITPEPEFSYVSFEANIPLPSYLKLIQRVVDTFLPGKFILTIFANRTSCSAESHKELQSNSSFGEWIRTDISYSQVQNYELTYAHFVRFPS